MRVLADRDGHAHQGRDPYAALDLDPGASAEDITRAYRHLLRQLHPDTALPEPAEPGRLADVLAAYRIIGDPQRRAAYDAGRHRSPAAAPRPAPPAPAPPAPAPPATSQPAPGPLAAGPLASGPPMPAPPAPARGASGPAEPALRAGPVRRHPAPDPSRYLFPRPGGGPPPILASPVLRLTRHRSS